MLPNTGSDIAAMNTNHKSRLLSIPGEIRNKIWRMLLTTRETFKEPKTEGDREAHYELEPAILRVNRQIHNETHRILKEENMWIFVCIVPPKGLVFYMDEAARLPVISRSILAEPNQLERCYLGRESHALNIFLCRSLEYTPPGTNCDFHTMIMGPESLPYLLQLIFTMLYTHHGIPLLSKQLQMYVGYPVYFARPRLQREILEPFLAARGFQFVLIDGNVEETLASSMMLQMHHSFQTEAELLDYSDTYLKKGDDAAAAGLTKAASFFYEQGSNFTFFAGQSYLDKHQPLVEHVYSFVTIASMLTAFDIKWAKALLKLQCYADVQRLAVSVLGKQKQFRATIPERIQLVLYCALASLGLGQTDRFSQIMLGLWQGTCDLGVFHTKSGSTPLLRTRVIFPNKRSVKNLKGVIIKSLDEIVSYCKEGEEGSFRRFETGEGLPDREEIEFPVAQDWSGTAARYERRRENWARNLSVGDLI